MSETAAPEPPARRTSPGLGPLAALVLLVLAGGALGLRAWQSAGQAPTISTSPTASALGQVASASPSEVPPPTPAPSASPSASPSSDDSATAGSVATEYETARASGHWQAAWSMLSAYSQSVIGSLSKFEQLEKAYNASGGSTFTIQDPTQNPDLLAPEFLGQAYLDAQAKADISRAWLVFVDHPKVRGASAASSGLLVAPIGDRWYVWIAH